MAKVKYYAKENSTIGTHSFYAVPIPNGTLTFDELLEEAMDGKSVEPSIAKACVTERMKAGCLQAVGFILMIVLGLALCALLGSCTTTKYVPVVHTHEQHHWHTDSVHEKDSTYHENTTIIQQLDSAAMAKYGIQMDSNQRAWLVLQREMENRLRELEHMTAQRDTVRDSVPVPYPVIKEVPAKQTWWQQTRLHLANILLYLMLIVGIIYCGRRHLKKYLP